MIVKWESILQYKDMFDDSDNEYSENYSNPYGEDEQNYSNPYDEQNQYDFSYTNQFQDDERVDEETVQNEWQDYFYNIENEYDDEREKIREMYRQLKVRLTEAQKKYKRAVEQKAMIEYYKMEFKFDLEVNQIYRNRRSLNAKTLFQTLFREFQKLGFELCEISVKTYVKDINDKEHKYVEKISRMEKQIENLLKSNCYNLYVQNDNTERTYKMIPIEQKRHQFIHFVIKLPQNDDQRRKKLMKTSITANFEGNIAKLIIQQNKYVNKDYLSVSNNAYCNSLSGWDLGCRVKSGNKQTFYSYFQPTGEQWVTFSRSMQKDEQSEIRQICVYNRFESTIVLKTTIKKQQIYLLSYSKNQTDFYIFLTSPPIYEFAILPPNTYCLPNYLSRWQRAENFIFTKHKQFKDNDFLRLFLYSNSYMHLKLPLNDEISFKNIKMDIELIQLELNCKSQILPADIENSKQRVQLLKLFNPLQIQSGLKFINIPDRPNLTAHIKWKLSYQIMLLVRFNVIGPDDLPDFLKLAQRYHQKIDKFIECLSRKSAGYTNKVAGLNRFRKGVYEKLKQKIEHFFKCLEKNIPKSKQRQIFQQQSCLIYKVSLTPSGILPNPVSPQTKCRLIREYEAYSDFFMKVTLSDDVGDNMKNQRYIYSKIMRRLLDNVNLLGMQYVPLGWSGSQLRASSLWYVREVKSDEGEMKAMTQQSILNFLGDFSKIEIPAKKAARIGQAFSSSYHYNSQDVKEIIQQDDKSSKKFLYTDGIGMISRQLFQDIKEKFKKMKLNINCCIQIRYKGAKGVLLLNENLQGKTIVLRKSMIKYECTHPAAKKYLDILNWDKYYSGYLNRQIIILLKTLDISDQVFLDFQRRYIKRLNALDFSEIDGNLLRNLSQGDDSEDSFCITIKSLRNNFKIQRDLFFQKFLQSIKDTKFTQLKKKSRILIDKSARLIGVIDDYNVLNAGELYCCIQKLHKGKKKRENIIGDVIITRNPSLSPTDVRKCKCPSLQQIGERFKKLGVTQNPYKQFVNCIVFPKKSAIPLTSQISGSDLDGDIFFICWEKNFIIKQHLGQQTLDDPNQKPTSYFGGSTYKEMLDFFIDFANSEKLGRINNTHTVHADQSELYAKCQQCTRLALIHFDAVDYAKSGKAPQDVPRDLAIRIYPDFMQKWNKPYYESESVMGKLYRQCRAQIQDRKENQKERQLYFSPQILKHIDIKKTTLSLAKEVIEQLTKFQQEVTDLLSHVNVSSEFELYAGSSANNQELKNDFGRKRLTDWLQELRDRHQSIFFENLDKDIHLKLLSQYKKLKNRHLKNQQLFPTFIKQKATLAYIISYYCYCNRQGEHFMKDMPQDIRDFCNKLKKMQDKYRYQGNYLGFVWFVIPKIVINMQNFGLVKKKKDKKEVEIEKSQ